MEDSYGTYDAKRKDSPCGCKAGGTELRWQYNDPELMDAAGILEYEMVQIVDVENGNRFETYTICGEAGSGMICLNGAAARQVQVGDHVIIMCYASMTPEEAKTHRPKVVFVDEKNKIHQVSRYEKHGELGPVQ